MTLPLPSDPDYLHRQPNGVFLASDMLDEDALSSITQLYPSEEWRQLAKDLHLKEKHLQWVEEMWQADPLRVKPVEVTLRLWMEFRNDCLLVTLRDVLRDSSHAGCAGFVQRLWEGRVPRRPSAVSNVSFT